MHEVDVATRWIPLVEPGADTAPVLLESIVYRPRLQRPCPVVMFHHGSTGPGLRRPTETERPDAWGRHLAARGIALVAPMRRGRGRSGGVYLETYHGDADASRTGIAYALASTQACEDYVRQQPWADATHLLLAGTSRGGMLALWHAARRPGGCVGAIAFAPGWTSARSDAASGEDINCMLLSDIAGSIEVPCLVLYAEADAYYPPSVSRRYAGLLAARQPRLRTGWVDAPGGHRFFALSPEAWCDPVDCFIDACLALPPATS